MQAPKNPGGRAFPEVKPVAWPLPRARHQQKQATPAAPALPKSQTPRRWRAAPARPAGRRPHPHAPRTERTVRDRWVVTLRQDAVVAMTDDGGWRRWRHTCFSEHHDVWAGQKGQ